MMKVLGKIALGLALGVLILALIAGGVLAQSPGKPTTPAPDCGIGGGSRFGRMGGPAWGRVPVMETMVELTGLTEEEIIEQRHDGQSLAEIAAAYGVTEQELVEAILASKKAVLDDLVAQGKLTEEQVEQMLANMAEQVTLMITRTETGPNGQGCGGFGRGNGLRGGRGRAPAGSKFGTSST